MHGIEQSFSSHVRKIYNMEGPLEHFSLTADPGGFKASGSAVVPCAVAAWVSICGLDESRLLTRS